MATRLFIGTRKGLFTAECTDGTDWKVSEPEFLMREVPAIGLARRVDVGPAPPRLLVGFRSEHWGPTLVRSEDLGATWEETPQGSIVFPQESGAALARIWQLQGDPVRPGRVWAGCEPTSLWRSDDAGETFTLVKGLWDHPHRPHWAPGFGGAAVHTIVTDPDDDAHVIVAMSTGGVYVTHDAGQTWTPSNTGITAYFLPDPNPEYGQCVHKVAVDAVGTGTLYAQNHHGVYRSDDGGGTWTSIAGGLPSDFGFVMLAHPGTPGTAWVVPLEADARRVPPAGRLRMHRTRDGGQSWRELGGGLPEGSWTSVLRDAACVVDRGEEPPVLAFGTRDGAVYASSDEGDTMVEVALHLPDVLCVRGVVLE